MIPVQLDTNMAAQSPDYRLPPLPMLGWSSNTSYTQVISGHFMSLMLLASLQSWPGAWIKNENTALQLPEKGDLHRGNLPDRVTTPISIFLGPSYHSGHRLPDEGDYGPHQRVPKSSFCLSRNLGATYAHVDSMFWYHSDSVAKRASKLWA